MDGWMPLLAGRPLGDETADSSALRRAPLHRMILTLTNHTLKTAASTRTGVDKTPAKLGVSALAADGGKSAAALSDFPCDPFRAQAAGGVLGLLEHGPCALEVLGPTAGDQRARPPHLGAGE
jgi:hypothetical protein